MKVNLTLEEAIALRNELSVHCVSYYSYELRCAMDKTIKYLDEIIEEHEEVLLDPDSTQAGNV